MNRRSFIKLSVMTGIGVMLPVEFLIDNRDPETKFMQHIMENYNELQVIELIKKYAWTTSKGEICSFLHEFVVRQPIVVDWLKKKLARSAPDNAVKQAYEKQKRSGILSYEMSIWGTEEYDKLAQRFNLKRDEKLFSRLEWMKKDLAEIREIRRV